MPDFSRTAESKLFRVPRATRFFSALTGAPPATVYPHFGQPFLNLSGLPVTPQAGQRTEAKKRPHFLQNRALRGTSAPQLSQKNFAAELVAMAANRDNHRLGSGNNRHGCRLYAAVSLYARAVNRHAVLKILRKARNIGREFQLVAGYVPHQP